jgi:DNA-binding transcriptional MerR regulator
MSDSINEQHFFAPHDVAGMFNVSVMTVRRWADYHKEHLSVSANPPAGAKRYFTWADVETFRQIKAWRDEGLSVEVINKRLTSNVTESITPTVTDNSAIAPVAAQESPQQAPASIVTPEYFMTIERRFEALETSRRDAITMLGIGICIGLLFAAILIGLAWLYGG